MKLYYHKTDGGAEYYSTTHTADSDDGALDTAVMRTDGNEIEIFADRLQELGISLVIRGGSDS